MIIVVDQERIITLHGIVLPKVPRYQLWAYFMIWMSLRLTFSLMANKNLNLQIYPVYNVLFEFFYYLKILD